jgi:CRP-like cAMP-binding protein
MGEKYTNIYFIEFMLNLQTQELVMSAQEVAKCASFASVIKYHCGQTIHLKGSNQSGLSIVCTGSVKIGNYDLKGRYQHRATLHPGATFGEATLFNHVNRTHNATAGENCSVIQMNKSQFDACAQQESFLMPFLLRSISAKLNFALEQLDDITRLPSHVRLAKLLLTHCDDNGLVLLNQSDLADLLNLTVLSCHKALKKLAHHAFIHTSYRKIHIVDTDALQTFIDDFG